MFGLGLGEILLILIVALIVFGPTRLPDLARTVGKAMGEFRRASRDLRETFEVEMYRMDEPSQKRPEPPSRAPSRLIEAEVEPIAGAPVARPLPESVPASVPLPRTGQPADAAPPPAAVDPHAAPPHDHG